MSIDQDGRRRVVIEGLSPAVDCGQFPAKRIAGKPVVVTADVFADGHDELVADMAWRREDGGTGARAGGEVVMEALGNDRWAATFLPEAPGRYQYRITGWIDRFATWRRGFRKKLDAGISPADLSVELLIGADLVDAAAKRAVNLPAGGPPRGARKTGRAGRVPEAEQLRAYVERLSEEPDADPEAAFEDDLAALMAAYPDTELAVSTAPYPVVVDRPRAGFSAWYELFPRSTSADPRRHGTFADVEARLPYVAGMGFDVLYLPPIHPIGTTHRKGVNNNPQARPSDPGSPWAIGGKKGGHTAVHPDLGTLADFDHLVAATERFGMEIALDFAIQCSPDHPWVKEHPEWFRRRPDGTLQYAENPPKKYEDIYPVDFESESWEELWEALAEVVEFWIGHGVKIFRVDNPHTKAFAFWDWLISRVHADHPDVLFLAEAFTRPRVMQRLAKLGFTQSYTYFTWRTTKAELTEYATEVFSPPLSDYFRANFWPNTPDILAVQLQSGGRAGFIARLVLAACLSPSFGIYGPAFELGERTPIAPGSEEYAHSEKYEIRTWDLARMDSLSELVAQVNRARRQHPALQGPPPVFETIDNDQLIAWSKVSEDGTDVVIVVVNLDPVYAQSGWLTLDLEPLGLPVDAPYVVEDLLTGSRFPWSGPTNFIRLDPIALPAHILAVRPPARPADEP
ncbi:MAG TPA: maltotransferase domain-containing protein [Actinomycetota bacterium]|nr:maltotransferase domain-containing protein [Actinomycetota bacterium]